MSDAARTLPHNAKEVSPEWEQALADYRIDLERRKVKKVPESLNLLRGLANAATEQGVPFSGVTREFIDNYCANRGWAARSTTIYRGKLHAAIRRLLTIGYTEFPPLPFEFVDDYVPPPAMPGVSPEASEDGGFGDEAPMAAAAQLDPNVSIPPEQGQFNLQPPPAPPRPPAIPLRGQGVPAQRAAAPAAAPAQTVNGQAAQMGVPANVRDPIGMAMNTGNRLKIMRIADMGVPGVMPGRLLEVQTVEGRELFGSDVEQYINTYVLPTQHRSPQQVAMEFALIEEDGLGRQTGRSRRVALMLPQALPGVGGAADPQVQRVEEELTKARLQTEELQKKLAETKEITALNELRRAWDEADRARRDLEEQKRRLEMRPFGQVPGMPGMPGMPGFGAPGFGQMPFGQMPGMPYGYGAPPPPPPMPEVHEDTVGTEAMKTMGTVLQSVMTRAAPTIDPGMKMILDSQAQQNQLLMNKMFDTPRGPDITAILMEQTRELRDELRALRAGPAQKSFIEQVREVTELQRMLAPQQAAPDEDDGAPQGILEQLMNPDLLRAAGEFIASARGATAPQIAAGAMAAANKHMRRKGGAPQQAEMPEAPPVPQVVRKTVVKMVKAALVDNAQGCVDAFFELQETMAGLEDGYFDNAAGLIVRALGEVGLENEGRVDLTLLVKGLLDVVQFPRESKQDKAAARAIVDILHRNFPAIHEAYFGEPRELDDAPPRPTAPTKPIKGKTPEPAEPEEQEEEDGEEEGEGEEGEGEGEEDSEESEEEDEDGDEDTDENENEDAPEEPAAPAPKPNAKAPKLTKPIPLPAAALEKPLTAAQKFRQRMGLAQLPPAPAPAPTRVEEPAPA